MPVPWNILNSTSRNNLTISVRFTALVKHLKQPRQIPQQRSFCQGNTASTSRWSSICISFSFQEYINAGFSIIIFTEKNEVIKQRYPKYTKPIQLFNYCKVTIFLYYANVVELINIYRIKKGRSKA